VPRVVSFDAPLQVSVVEEEAVPLEPGKIRLRTLYSGISAGTELTAYRGTNPYLNRRWDPASRLFVEGEVGLTYPVRGWGYEECGEVVEVAEDVSSLDVGDRVWGQWGHRAETVQLAAKYAGRRLPEGAEPELGIFSQIGAIALNLVLDADIHLGETVVLFGLGVPGQLAAQMARLNGARVVGVDSIASRRDLAKRLGADVVLDPAEVNVGAEVRELTGGRGADVVLEVTGNYAAMHDAIRCAAYNSRVIVASFLQGPGTALRLGEEFHHNRIEVVSSQISGVAPRYQHRWDFERLSSTAMELITSGRVCAGELITQRFAAVDAPAAFELLHATPSEALQVVLDFTKE